MALTCALVAVSATVPDNASAAAVGHPQAQVSGWGSNSFGQLADGTLVEVRTPTPITTLPANTRRVAAGSDFAVALLSDGTVLSWGANHSGQLGDGTTRSRPRPVPVPGLSGIVQVSAGDWHVLAMDVDGNVWAWGDNARGQVGDGTTTGRSSPVKLSAVGGFVQVSAGARFSLGLRGDGTVWAWGANDWGQLGDGTQEDRAAPHRVGGLTGVTQIAGASGGNHSLAVRSDGTVWGWGSNSVGELGDGNPTNFVLAPVQAVGLSGVTEVAAGEMHSLAAADGGVWSWGANFWGQLGDGTLNDRATPAELGIEGVIQVGAGYSHSAVRLAGGTMWAWGTNFHGQLGAGSDELFTNVPVPVPGVADVAHISLGFGFDLAVLAPRQPIEVLVPDLTGLGADEAFRRLRSVGLFGQHIGTPSSCGRVTAQNPGRGARVSIGSVVGFEIQRGSAGRCP
jgi:alpha-tubulin suppressor-like RCC1 family protein